MVLGFPVSSDRLHQKKINMGKETVAGASIFPFFDITGKVQRIMLLLPDSNEVFLIDWQPKLINIPFLGSIQLSIDPAAIKSCGAFKAEAVKGLYHYDPWWVLSKSRYRRHWALDLLKSTNCTGGFKEKVHYVNFDNSLSELKYLMIHIKSSERYRQVNLNQMTWKSEFLASVNKTTFHRIPKLSPIGWHFDPIWQNWRKKS